MMRARKLVFFTLSDVGSSPYPEVALPCLAKAGWDISIFAPNAARSILRAAKPFQCEAHDLIERNHGMQELSTLIAMAKTRFSDADVIYINSQGLSSRAYLALLGPLGRKKLVYHNPDFYDPFTNPARFALEGRLARKTDLYINNEFHRGYITKVLYRLSCPIITAPPNLPSGWPVPQRSPEARLVLTNGQDDAFVLIQHGGFSTLRMVPQSLEALSLLPARFRLAFTGGEATQEALDPHLRKWGIEGRVSVLPRLGFNEMLKYTVNADAGMLLYANNDLGNFFTSPGRITEYVACGLPVLATNHTGLENLVMKTNVGACVDSTRPRNIADGIATLAESKAQGRFSREGMRKSFLDALAFDHWEQDVVDAFEALASGESRHPALFPKFPWMRST